MWDSTASGHGTFVAGLIALTATKAKIIPLRAFGNDGRGTSFDIAKAIRFATDAGADVINMSFGMRRRIS
ncbi:MAG: S8 family serine peptidase [Acidobacteria bacterium]|nr:S8 family serine peptidase [Acidobacteriota bacterium]